jgi:probable HAF family extracellular repeat protein
VAAYTCPLMASFQVTDRARGLAALAAVAALAAIALVASPAGAAPERQVSIETVTPAGPSGAFVYRKGRLSPVAEVPGAAVATTVGINNRCQTTGSHLDPGATPNPDGVLPTHGFVRNRRGAVTRFDVPRALFTESFDINNQGRVAGTYADAGATLNPDGSVPRGVIHGFVRKPNGAVTTVDVPGAADTTVLSLNDRGQLVGIYDKYTAAPQGFLRDRDGDITKIEVPGAAQAPLGPAPYGINNRGQVVGSFTDPGVAPNPDGAVPPRTVHGFLWQRGRRITKLDVPGSVLTVAYGINDRGQVAGAYRDARGRQHGFLFHRGRYTTIDAPRPVDDDDMGNIAWGINDRGEVLVPEPGAGVRRVAP